MKFLRIASLLVILLLSACGFHLRGEAQLPAGMQRLGIEGADPLSPLGRDLRKALTRSGAQVVDDTAERTTLLRIVSNQISTDVFTVGGDARATEYTMRYHVEFDVIDAAGAKLLPIQKIELTRVFVFDSSQALGIVAEQDLLTKELQREMIQKIMRKLEVIGNASKS